MIKVKRIYDPPEAKDGLRILVDRLFPRSMSKEKAQFHSWDKELAPSNELRRWFGHDPARWEEFRYRYRLELEDPSKKQLLKGIKAKARSGDVTLLFAASDVEHNNAVVLKEVLENAPAISL